MYSSNDLLIAKSFEDNRQMQVKFEKYRLS